MTRILAAAIGGAIGAMGRYGLSGLIHRYLKGAFPYGTLAVNVIGCLAIAGILHLVEDRSMLTPTMRTFITIGLLGGFTTFSSLGYETVELLRDGVWGLALANVAANVVLGIGAVWLGRQILRGIRA